jgi:PAS domain S-box-containing protein
MTVVPAMQTDTEPGAEFGIAPPFWRGRDALVVADGTSGRIVGWNPAAVSLFGYAPGEAAALVLPALVPSLDLQTIAGCCDTADGDLPADAARECIALHKGGRELPVEATLVPLVPSGSSGRVLAILLDRSEQKRAEAERIRLLDQSHALQIVAAELASRRDLSGLLDAIVERTRDVLGSRACAVWLINDDGAAQLKAASGLSEPYRRWLEMMPRPRLGVSSDSEMLAGRPSLNPDVPNSIRAQDPEWAERIEAEGFLTALRLPLHLPGGAVMGWLNLMDGERRYEENEVRLAQAFADQMAVALQNARVEAERLRLLEQSHALQTVAAELSSRRDLAGLLAAIVERTRAVLGAHACTVWLVADDGSAELKAASGLSEPYQRWLRSLPRRRINATADAEMRAGQSSFQPDFPASIRDHDPEMAERSAAEGFRSMLRLPLRLPGGAIIGSLALLHGDRRYEESEVRLAQAFADQIAIALHNARLAEETEGRTRELTALLDVAASLASTIQLEPLLDLILDQVQVVAGYDGAVIGAHDGEQVRILRRRAPTGIDPDHWQLRGYSQARFTTQEQEALRRREPLIIDDIRGDDAPAQDFRASVGEPPEATHLSYVRSWMAVPLALTDRVIGRIVLTHEQPGYYTPHHAELVLAIATQAAAAIENARANEQERAARAEAVRQLERMTLLAEITRQLLGATELETVLRVVTESAWRLCDARTATIMLTNSEGGALTLQGFDAEVDAPQGGRVIGTPLDATAIAGTPIEQALRERTAVATEDLRRLPPSVPRDRGLAFGLLSGITAPLLVEGRPLGVLNVGDTRARTFASEDVALVQALADQAALAIEHARLTRRGQDAAVLEERARLARDLHDSVTQSLFSMSLMSESLPRLLERQPDRAIEQIAQINELSRSGLAELRSLIFELRPLALTNEGLASALQKHVVAFQRREHLTVNLEIGDGRRLPPSFEESLFRIAQECLNNVAKHARASRVDLRMRIEESAVELTVADDGAGFDPAAPAGGRRSLGMTSMAERAMLLGGTCTVASAPGAGTRVTVRLPLLTAEAGGR